MHERLTLAVVVSFLDERDYLPTLLSSIDRQTRPPDRLLLVDDGSGDGSLQIARTFARSHPYAAVLERPRRAPGRDRLAQAAELRAFQWAVGCLDGDYDAIAKLDADLELRATHFAEVCDALAAEPRLGIVGASLSIRARDGSLVREDQPPEHVRGPNKFYRGACLSQITPLPEHLGWDTVDELKARMCGWETRSITLSGGDSVHLRPTGAHDGRLRACWRWGQCAYGFGSHPLAVAVGGARRVTRRPFLIGGLAYVLGWLSSALASRPRAPGDVRAFRRHEELQRALARVVVAR